MQAERETKVAACPDTSGTMPACAPLAVPYVPFQQRGSSQYSPADALSNGTLFPGLNLPFFVKPDAKSVGTTPMTELQALEFVILELGLYLDTHPNDSEAFGLYSQFVKMERAARQSYVAANGPLFQPESADGTEYGWVRGNWPWNTPEGGRR